MGRVTTQVDNILKLINEINGTPKFINAGSTTERELREELDDNDLMIGGDNMTQYLPSDEHSMKYRGLSVMVEPSEAADFLSVTYTDALGQQKELDKELNEVG